jgi:FkbM family methyltransferase
LLSFFGRLRRREYESDIRSALVKYIHPGQVIWDVGANEGFYVDILLELIGQDGIIVAFEPSPDSYGILKQKFHACPNVHLENVALSDQDGIAWFFQSPITVTNSLVDNDNATTKIQVSVKRGDTYANTYFPNVVKIDVEGYEYEVLKGMSQILRSAKLKCIVLEVHFSILRKRGLRDAPKSIVHMLTEAGLAVRWTDPSHLLASRV